MLILTITYVDTSNRFCRSPDWSILCFLHSKTINSAIVQQFYSLPLTTKSSTIPPSSTCPDSTGVSTPLILIIIVFLQIVNTCIVYVILRHLRKVEVSHQYYYPAPDPPDSLSSTVIPTAEREISSFKPFAPPLPDLPFDIGDIIVVSNSKNNLFGVTGKIIAFDGVWVYFRTDDEVIKRSILNVTKV